MLKKASGIWIWKVKKQVSKKKKLNGKLLTTFNKEFEEVDSYQSFIDTSLGSTWPGRLRDPSFKGRGLIPVICNPPWQNLESFNKYMD